MGKHGYSETAVAHVQGPKRYPSWAPELGNRAMGECGQRNIFTDSPLVRELDDNHPVASETRVKIKRYRASEAEPDNSACRKLPQVHGHEVPLIIGGAPEIEAWSLLGNFGSSARRLVSGRMGNIRLAYPNWWISA